MRMLSREISSFLREHGPSPASEIAFGIRARRVEVDESLAQGPFTPTEHPEGGSARATYWSVSERVPSRVGKRARAMLEVLQDGRRHSRAEIFRLAGDYFLTNNAAAELRAAGYDVRQAQEGRGNFVYWLNQPTVRPAALEVAGMARISGEAAA